MLFEQERNRALIKDSSSIFNRNLSAQFVNQLQATRITYHCKSERSVFALKTGPFRWVKYSPIFESNLAPLNQGEYGAIQSNYLGLIWTQGTKLAPAWAVIAFWLSCFGLNCAQMAPGGPESDFGLQGCIGTLGLKQIFLIFRVESCPVHDPFFPAVSYNASTFAFI